MISKKDFNEKYGLSSNDIALIKLANKDFVFISEIVGSPSTRLKDILKKFFFNIWGVIGLILFLIILLMIIIVPLTSPFSSVDPIAKISNDAIEKLPPTFWDFKEETYKGNYLQVLIDAEKAGKLKYGDDFKIIYSVTDASNYVGKNLYDSNFVPIPRTEYFVSYSPYKFIQIYLKQDKSIYSILGTDMYGRDIWTRIFAGAGNVLLLSFVINTIKYINGIVLGSYLAFNINKKIDLFLMRVIEVLSAIPALLQVIILIGIFGTSSISIAGVLLFIGFLGPVETVRMWVATVKDRDFINASKSLGTSKWKVIYLEAFPIIAGKLITGYIMALMSGAYMYMSLTFLGFISDFIGSDANLGLSIYSLRDLKNTNALAFYSPIILLLLLVTSLKMISTAMHDALDPVIKKGAK
ncbi:ABC transporter permease subunit [Candidatus Mycoplasma pogonae]